MRTIPILLALSISCGCASTAKLNPAELEATLMAADQAFSDFSEANDFVAAFDEFLLDESLYFVPGSPPLEDKKSIVALLAQAPPSLVTWKPTGARSSGAGDLGYTWGWYEIRPLGMPDEDAVSSGNYVTIWTRDTDGAWKVSLDIGTQ